MIYTTNTRKAMILAYNAHLGQFDKSGLPYIYHPIHLAEQMETEEECIVAILHDTVEDTNITFEQLEREFSQPIIEALKLLTHSDNEDYFEYITKISQNDIATKVKKSDLLHNMNLERLDVVTEADLLRKLKYEKAYSILEEKKTRKL